MENKFKSWLSVCTILLLVMQMSLSTSCNDDLSAEKLLHLHRRNDERLFEEP